MLLEAETLDGHPSDVSAWHCRASVQLSAPQEVSGAWDGGSRKPLCILTAALPWCQSHSPMLPIPNHRAGMGEVKLSCVLFTYISA